MEFKGTKEEIHAVEYAGVIFMQDSEFYEDSEKCNILDYDHVGKIEADANGKLFECAPEMLEKLKESLAVISWYMDNTKPEDNQHSDFFNIGMNQRQVLEELISKATTI